VRRPRRRRRLDFLRSHDSPGSDELELLSYRRLVGELRQPDGGEAEVRELSKVSSQALFGRSGTPTIAIVGAGFGGIGLGVLLKKARIDTFTIYEKADGVGGAWWHNRYPGAEVDTISYVYSYPFKSRAWTRTHAKQPELRAYLEDTVAQFGLRPHLRLGTAVESAEWDETSCQYALVLSTGETAQCHVLVGATGFLNIPKYPSWPGLEDFAGPMFHTSRWEQQHDLAGKTVAVVGTGSTATQVIPELVDLVGKLYVFQREPGWIIPKGERDHTPKEQARLANPRRYRLARLKWFWNIEKRTWRGGPWRPGSKENEAGRHAALAFIQREFADRPDLVRAVTPAYPFWGKRLVFSSKFYAALKHPNVQLVPTPVRSLTQTGVVDAEGVERSVDVLILATGFATTDYVGTVNVSGADGRTLKEQWGGEPRAFLGITVPNFPNFYIMYGPGTNGGEIVSILLRQAEHIVRTVKRMAREGVPALEVRPAWVAVYDAWLQSQMTWTSWAVSDNYYKASTGKIVTQWPFSPGIYGLLVRVLGRPSQTGRRRQPGNLRLDVDRSNVSEGARI
jgi:cation diffusion facilitator CzcD-associated flavoprotein CzcO